MKYKNDKFFISGRVHPLEYDWEQQFSEIIQQADKHCIPFVCVDSGKLAGLCAYIKELEAKVIPNGPK